MRSSAIQLFTAALALAHLVACTPPIWVAQQPGPDWVIGDQKDLANPHPPDWALRVNHGLDSTTFNFTSQRNGSPIQVLGLYLGGYPDFPKYEEFKSAKANPRHVRIGLHRAQVLDGEAIGRPGITEGLIKLGGQDANRMVHFWFRDLDVRTRNQVVTFLASLK